MKISIITITLNSEKTLAATLNSVVTQNYQNIEHIFVDGGSTDQTIKMLKDYPLKNKKIFIKKKSTIYQAMNLGVRKSTGQVISILNSDDFYNNYDTIKKITVNFKNSTADILLGDVVYFNNKNYNQAVRLYANKKFDKKNFIYGLMPPHPGAFIKKDIYNRYGLYDEKMTIAADFDLLLRFIHIKNCKTKVINFITTRMRTGGMSGKNILSNLISTYEIRKSLIKNKVKSNYLFILLRLFLKLPQLYNFKKEILKKYSNIKIDIFYKKYFQDHFTLIFKPQKILLRKNFIFSAMNLAFIGSYISGKDLTHPDLIHWPDGIFAKLFNKKIPKIPGRKVILLLKKTIKKSNINELVVLGNLGAIQKHFLKNLYNIKITEKRLPYGSVDLIKRRTKFIFNSKQLCFITLPTPKQEELAIKLANENKFYKIICIGASINIASGTEMAVPKLLSNFEFLWRLRYEPMRRMSRLLVTFFYFFYGKFFSNKMANLKVRIEN